MATPAKTGKTTLSKWKAAARHTVTLASGTQVDIVLPNLPQLIKTGEIPNTLLQAAIQAESAAVSITPETIKEQFEFFSFLVSKTVVEPQISEADVSDLPYEDIEMIAEFATRQRDLDAVGHHLAGLEQQSDFRQFRGLESRNEIGSGV